MAPSPIPREVFRQRMESVAKALKWPVLAPTRSDSGAEEVRLWAGTGAKWPSMVFRLRRTPGETKLEQAFWWAQGPYSESIRRNFHEDAPGACSRIIRSQGIEACSLGWHQSPTGLNAVWKTGAAQQVRSLVLGSTEAPSGSNDSVDVGIAWYDGTRVGQLLPSMKDSSTTRALGCLLATLLQQNPDLRSQTSVEDLGCEMSPNKRAS
jgi:hypothetical protein